MAAYRRRFGRCRRRARFASAPCIDGRRCSGARLEWPRHPRRTRIDRKPSARGFGAASIPRHLGTRGAAARRRGLATLARSSTWKRGDPDRNRRRPDRPGHPAGVNVERPRRASRCEPWTRRFDRRRLPASTWMQTCCLACALWSQRTPSSPAQSGRPLRRAFLRRPIFATVKPGPAEASASFAATPLGVSLDPLQVAIGANTIAGRTMIDFDNNTLRGELTANLSQIAALAADVPAQWRPRGSARAEAQFSGALDNPTVAAELSSDDLGFAGQAFRQLRASAADGQSRCQR